MIKVISYTENPLTLMGECAAVCWDSTPSPQIGKHCLSVNHGRVTEYVDVILEISGYSARMIRELYTHVQGVSRLQQSTRYVESGDFGYFVPDSIFHNQEAMNIYVKNMQKISENYKELQALGIKKEDIANILPLGMHTKIVLKINLRALIHMFHERTCNRAYEEYREFMRELLYKLSRLNMQWEWIANRYFQTKCEQLGYCPEGKNGCGRYPERNEVITS